MLLVPEIKTDKEKTPSKPLTEQDIRNKLYGVRSTSAFESGIHPQLAQAKARIAELEEAIEISREREAGLLARTEELAHEKKELEKLLSRSEREREKLSHRLTGIEAGKQPQGPESGWTKAQHLVENGIKGAQRLISRRSDS